MKTFCINPSIFKKNLIRMAIVIASFFICLIAEIFVDDDLKSFMTFFLICEIACLVIQFISVKRMTREIIVNENNICINTGGILFTNSKLIPYSNIRGVGVNENVSPTGKGIVVLALNTSTGMIIINNIEESKQCAEMIEYRINNDSFEGYNY